jgi:hypothetical protein
VPPGFATGDIEAALDDLSTITQPADPGSCLGAYERLYRKDLLDIRVFLGYLNQEADPGVRASDWVLDPYLKWSLEEILTRPCKGSLSACGFVRSPESEDILLKPLPGPDGRMRTARIMLENASASDSDRRNRTELKHEQRERSDRIARDFAASLDGADIVIYDGHARRGTGPGFKPLPKLHWSWIEAGLFRPSLRGMLRALRESRDPPALVGYFACKVDRYYATKLGRAAPAAGLVVSATEKTSGGPDRIPTSTDNVASLLGMLNAVLGQQCSEVFARSLVLAELKGFFGGLETAPTGTSR